MTDRDCQDLLTQLVRYEKMSRVKPPVTLKIYNKRGSNASYQDHTIRLSRSQYQDSYYGRLALIVHEFAHLVAHHKNGLDNLKPHGKEFKRQETRLLKLYGLTIERDGAYAKTLYSNGKEVWHK